ncbi:GNAT family N-acetyltransferase [Acidisoma cladoniae]|jgi:ribosomal protein S18 acetylase RimI-like enzyme|uniref:GNAT family N-acetyltransferase n=1 Tax=Acidisoma cladoniae TaxID=3040935 RepID=UPI0025502D6B|nr:GNAT family N-acetyltransferase [Acidisoma sp. PAMC 29798]
MLIRLATDDDAEAIWRIIGPIIAAGETYLLPRDWTRSDGLAYWYEPGHEVFVADEAGRVIGTCYLQANKLGGGSHVANCGFATAPEATGRGVARAMCLHTMERAKARGFRAMQFNFVVSSNARAVGLWTSLGFDTVGRLPEAFAHPTLGYVDGLVMFRRL